MEAIRERRTVTILPGEALTPEKVSKWANNLIAFTAPALAIFFGQLAIGVSWKVAWPLALYAFYAAVADLFKKWKKEEIIQ